MEDFVNPHDHKLRCTPPALVGSEYQGITVNKSLLAVIRIHSKTKLGTNLLTLQNREKFPSVQFCNPIAKLYKTSWQYFQIIAGTLIGVLTLATVALYFSKEGDH